MIKMMVKVEARTLVYDKQHLKRVLRAAGGEVASVARAMIRRGGPGPSKPGQPPSSKTGTLANSIKIRPFRSGEGVAVRDTAFYALFLEAGARGGGGASRIKANILPAGAVGARGKVLRGQNRMKQSAINRTRILLPRPFLSAALEARQESIGMRIQAAVLEGIKFQRIKA